MMLSGIVPDSEPAFAELCPRVLRRDSLSDFNDGCEDFAEMRAVILQARAAAMNDADAIPAPHRRLEIEQDEFVMA
jgi:hypothetical protein